MIIPKGFQSLRLDYISSPHAKLYSGIVSEEFMAEWKEAYKNARELASQYTEIGDGQEDIRDIMFSREKMQLVVRLPISQDKFKFLGQWYDYVLWLVERFGRDAELTHYYFQQTDYTGIPHSLFHYHNASDKEINSFLLLQDFKQRYTEAQEAQRQDQNIANRIKSLEELGYKVLPPEG